MLFRASSRNLFNCCQCSLCGVTTRLSCFWHNAPIFFRERTFFWEFPASEPVTYIGTFLFLVAPIPPKSISFPFLEIPESPVSKKEKNIVFGANILPLEVLSKFTGGIFRGKIFSGLHQKKFFDIMLYMHDHLLMTYPHPGLLFIHAGTHAYER